MWFSCGVHNLTIKAYISINTQLVATSAHVKILNGFSLNHTYIVAMKILLYLESMDS